ncbi:MAG: tRNA lysidine(34) synthetase TilS [Methylocella sp.]
MLIAENHEAGIDLVQADAGCALSANRAALFSPEAIARLFSSWETAQKILLAVSGGPDSIALMLLAAEWAGSRSQRIYVATVDHRLRKDSAFEAEQVAAWAAALGLPHATLVWVGSRPKSKIQELAREARYDLLLRHAAIVGADIVATAHHADDQAETILFRLLRGSGIGGLSGMTPALKRGEITLSRPLLQRSKIELIAICRAKAHSFISDPSNHNPAYARTRMRSLGALLAEHGLDSEALLRLGRRAARAEASLVEQARAVSAALPAKRDTNCFSADISPLVDQPEEVFLRFLGQEIAALGDPTRALRLERLETLTLAMRQALRAGAPLAATMGGTALQLGRGGVLTIRTEQPRRRGRANLQMPDDGL